MLGQSWIWIFECCFEMVNYNLFILSQNKIFWCMNEGNHLGTKFFQILLRHFNSSPVNSPLLSLSQLGSFKPNILKSWLAEATSMLVSFRLESSVSLRSALMASTTLGFVILLILARLNEDKVTFDFLFPLQ